MSRSETIFDPSDDLIVIDARIWGPRGDVPLRLVLDTGSTAVLVLPEIVDEIGYSARDGTVITTVSSAVGVERGYGLRVARIEALGFALADFAIHVLDLPEQHDIDGLIGLHFLQRFNYEIRSAEGRILVEEIAS